MQTAGRMPCTAAPGKPAAAKTQSTQTDQAPTNLGRSTWWLRRRRRQRKGRRRQVACCAPRERVQEGQRGCPDAGQRVCAGPEVLARFEALVRILQDKGCFPELEPCLQSGDDILTGTGIPRGIPVSYR